MWKIILNMIVEENIIGLKYFFVEIYIDDNFGLYVDKYDFDDVCKNIVFDYLFEVDNGNIIK